MKVEKASIYMSGGWALLILSAALTALLLFRPLAFVSWLASREPSIVFAIGVSLAMAAAFFSVARVRKSVAKLSGALDSLSAGEYGVQLDDAPGWLGDVPDKLNRLSLDLRERADMDRTLTDETLMLKQKSIGLEARLSSVNSDLSRKETQLGNVNSEILNANRSKAELVTRMGREMRLPLNTIIGITDFLSEQRAGALNERQLEYIEKIRSRASGILEMESNIMEYSMLDAAAPPVLQDVDMGTAAHDAASSVARLAGSTGVTVRLDVPGLVVKADPDMLRYIIQKLLHNAVKFNLSGGSVKLYAREVSVPDASERLALEGVQVPDGGAGFVELVVEDTGVGIDPGRYGELFRPFSQIPDDMGHKPAGAGLSLYIVKTFAERHGGCVWVEPAPAGGSVFHVLVRKDPDDAPSSSARQARRKVLIVEDDLDQLNVVAAFLAGGMYEIIKARDGMEALRILEDETPDIILTDVIMPRLDGIELCRAVRRQDRFKGLARVPVVLMTSRTDMDNKLSAIKAGADDVVFKPVDRRLLLERIKYLVEAKQELDGVMASYKSLEKEALVDPLTGLSNRRHLDDVIAREFANAKRYARNLSVLMMDLDHFKSYNDMFGHQAGDELLRSAASVFVDSVREVDFVARYGGEEFMVILPETSSELAILAAERIRRAVEHNIPVTLSIGQATFPDDAGELTELMSNADAALYHAKQNGRNRTSCYRDCVPAAKPGESD